MASKLPRADSKPKKEMQVLNVGCIKTGTSSSKLDPSNSLSHEEGHKLTSTPVAAAYRILGYDDVHHLLEVIFSHPEDYDVFDRASDAFFTGLTTFKGGPFSRADWDAALGRCEAVTDLGGLFAEQLVDAYPDAKVVLVERDVESWFRSVLVVIDYIYNPVAEVFARVEAPLLGTKIGPASQKFHRGWFAAQTKESATVGARERYREHNDMVRRKVAPERLLVFKLSDGWGPLCDFLGKEVPDVPFPRVNEAEEFKKMGGKVLAFHWRNLKRIYGRRFLAVAAVGIGVVAARYQGLL
jgi:hypothetical protein